MKLGPLTLFQRMHSNGTPIRSWVIASLHWNWSITWRWTFTWRPGLSGRGGPYVMRVYRGSPGLNFHAGINLPVVGSFSVQTQPNMPWKRAQSTPQPPAPPADHP